MQEQSLALHAETEQCSAKIERTIELFGNEQLSFSGLVENPLPFASSLMLALQSLQLPLLQVPGAPFDDPAVATVRRIVLEELQPKVQLLCNALHLSDRGAPERRSLATLPETQQEIMQALIRKGLFGLESIVKLPAEDRPTADRIAKWAIGSATATGHLKTSLSALVREGWIDNATHHQNGRGYFIRPEFAYLAEESGLGPD